MGLLFLPIEVLVALSELKICCQDYSKMMKVIIELLVDHKDER